MFNFYLCVLVLLLQCVNHMQFQITIKVNEKIYLRDPETSEVGKKLVQQAIDMIYEMGFEAFTFKKLAAEVKTTEATVYRYFENKHMLLLYILNWYWSYMEYLVDLQVAQLTNADDKLRAVIKLLTSDLPTVTGFEEYNKSTLNQIIIAESSKAYLVKEVNEINKNQVFKPYKDLCKRIAQLIVSYAPKYPFPSSLSSTLIETSHTQQFFIEHLPNLTDLANTGNQSFVQTYLTDLLFSTLDAYKKN